MKYSVLFLALLPAISHAVILPSGERIISGSVSIQRTPNLLQLKSPDANNVIVWDDFSVSKDGTVIIDNKSYLNIVQSDKASVIDGSILGASGGSLHLFNPNGITVGKGADIRIDNLTLSSSALDTKSVENFIDSGTLEFTRKGMGKVKVLGSVRNENICIDGSQVIIADIDSITPEDFKGNGVSEDRSVSISSSVKRIDIGGKTARGDLEEKFSIGSEDGLVNHTGKKVIADADDFMKIRDDLDGDYFIADDITLPELSAPVTGSSAFTGSIDGAFNTISYTMNVKGFEHQNVGLFSKLYNAKLANLKIRDASVTVDAPADSTVIGAVAGTMSGTDLNNIEVERFDVKLASMQGNTVYLGSIAGNAKSGSAGSLTGSFSEKTYQRIADFRNYAAGSIFGRLTGFVQQRGDIIFNDLNCSFDMPFASDNSTGNTPEVKKTSSIDTGSLLSGTYIDDNGYLSNRDFYCPFYIPKSGEATYSQDNPQIYDFTSLRGNEYFSVYDYASLKYGYPSGEISKPGVYTHTYENKTPKVRFYFTDGSRSGSKLTHTFTIKEPPVVMDESFMPTSPEDPDFDSGFTLNEETEIIPSNPENNTSAPDNSGHSNVIIRPSDSNGSNQGNSQSGSSATHTESFRPDDYMHNLEHNFSVSTEWMFTDRYEQVPYAVKRERDESYTDDADFKKFQKVVFSKDESKLNYSNTGAQRASGITPRLLASLGIQQSGRAYANNYHKAENAGSDDEEKKAS